jgi:hypothetical protein
LVLDDRVNTVTSDPSVMETIRMRSSVVLRAAASAAFTALTMMVWLFVSAAPHRVPEMRRINLCAGDRVVVVASVGAAVVVLETTVLVGGGAGVAVVAGSIVVVWS